MDNNIISEDLSDDEDEEEDLNADTSRIVGKSDINEPNLEEVESLENLFFKPGLSTETKLLQFIEKRKPPPFILLTNLYFNINGKIGKSIKTTPLPLGRPDISSTNCSALIEGNETEIQNALYSNYQGIILS